MSSSAINHAKKERFSSHKRNESSSTLSEEEKLISNAQKKYSGKYKTEMCKRWEEGMCEYKDKCIFAHGKHELRKAAILKENVLPKKKKCIQYFENGYCVFGSKCVFSHEEDKQTMLRRQRENEPDKERIQGFTNPLHPNTSNIPLFIDLERRNIYISEP